jgi:hypothetical protein
VGVGGGVGMGGGGGALVSPTTRFGMYPVAGTNLRWDPHHQRQAMLITLHLRPNGSTSSSSSGSSGGQTWKWKC